MPTITVEVIDPQRPDYPTTLTIDEAGEVAMVYHPTQEAETLDLAAGLGAASAPSRGGHVWPKRKLQRLAFQVLRRVCGPDGKVADWTRLWSGPWIVFIPSTGKTLDRTFETHAEAVKAEVDYILEALV
jgi:hypothetical protein